MATEHPQSAIYCITTSSNALYPTILKYDQSERSLALRTAIISTSLYHHIDLQHESELLKSSLLSCNNFERGRLQHYYQPIESPLITVDEWAEGHSCDHGSVHYPRQSFHNIGVHGQEKRKQEMFILWIPLPVSASYLSAPYRQASLIDLLESQEFGAEWEGSRNFLIFEHVDDGIEISTAPIRVASLQRD